MNIPFTGSMLTAQAVLCILTDLLKEHGPESGGWTEAFQNGREQGYTVCVEAERKNTSKKSSLRVVHIAVARSSDSVVIYPSYRNSPQAASEDAFDRCMSFRFDEFIPAAKACRDWLMDGIPQED